MNNIHVFIHWVLFTLCSWGIGEVDMVSEPVPNSDILERIVGWRFTFFGYSFELKILAGTVGIFNQRNDTLDYS